MVEESITDRVTEPKTYPGQLYKLRSLYIACLLGGPFASAYMLSHNFRILGHHRKAKFTWLVLLLFLASIIFLDALLTIPSLVFPMANLLLSVNTMNRYQETEIESYLAAGHKAFPLWEVLAISLFCLLLTYLLSIVFSSITL